MLTSNDLENVKKLIEGFKPPITFLKKKCCFQASLGGLNM